MTNYNTLGNRLKIGILRFSQKISQKFKKPKRKFLSDMIFGIISSKDCKITCISRALKEDISLKKTTERLGRNLSAFSENDRDVLMKEYISSVKSSIGSDTMLLIDGGDVTKPCSPKMESIGTVRDGSTGKFSLGYWTMGATALSDTNNQPIPVYESLYPCKKEGGLGSSAETLKCLQSLRENFNADNVRVFDSGFDSKVIVADLLGKSEKFILRVSQNRVAVHKREKSYIFEVARRTVCENDFVYTGKNGKPTNCKIGMTQVTVPSLNNAKLNLVVCKGYGEPLVLYTNLSESLEDIAVRVVKMFLMRWRIDEYYGFKKQELNFEDFRVRGLDSIKTLNLLLTIAAGYIGVLEENNETMAVELITVSKRVEKLGAYLKKTKFVFYSILDGISTVLASLRCGIAHYFVQPPPDNQLFFKNMIFLG